jgi:hypothetical protein
MAESQQKGIIIKGNDFALKSLDEASSLFDLYLAKVVNKGKDNESVEFKIYGYGMPLVSAVKAIIQYRVSNKKSIYAGKGDLSLVEYFNAWVREKNELLALFDLPQESWNDLVKVKSAILTVSSENQAIKDAEKEAEKQARKEARKAAKKDNPDVVRD